MAEKKCKKCLEDIKLKTVENQKTGEQDEKEDWLMCGCTGVKLNGNQSRPLPENWVETEKH